MPLCMNCGKQVKAIHFYKTSGQPRCKNRQTWTKAMRFKLISLWEQGYSDAQIATKLGVTADAVHIKRTRWKIGVKHVNRDVFGAREAARMLGFSCSKSITKSGFLRGRRSSVRCGASHKWLITREALEDMIRNERTWPSWTVERIADPQLRNLAVEVRGDVQYLTLGDAAKYFNVEANTVGAWIDRGWIPGMRQGLKGNHMVRKSDVERLAPRYVWGEGLKEAA